MQEGTITLDREIMKQPTAQVWSIQIGNQTINIHETIPLPKITEYPLSEGNFNLGKQETIQCYIQINKIYKLNALHIAMMY